MEVIALLAGAFNPITRAHLALARSALQFADTVLFAMPRRLPHKSYGTVTFEQRFAIVGAAIAGEPRFGAAITEGGLFREMAAEIAASHGPAQLWCVCGRDAAERIVAWDYGDGATIEEQLRHFGLLVADRLGTYLPPPGLAGRIRRLPLPLEYQEMSSTEVRRRLAEGEPWEHLVPPSAAAAIREAYG